MGEGRRAQISMTARGLAGPGLLALSCAGAVGCGLLIGLSDHEAYPVLPDDASGPPAEDAAIDAGDVADVEVATCDAGPDDPLYLNDAIDISVSEVYSCAVRATGAVVCWGSNFSGMLGTRPGDGGLKSSARPVVIAGVPGATRVATAFTHACAIDANKNVWCWGNQRYTGDGDPDPVEVPSPPRRVVDGSGVPLRGVTDVSAGSFHTCAIIEGGSVACWGDNIYKQLGPLVSDQSTRFAVLVPELGGALALSAGENHTCVLREAGKRQVDCWGLGGEGQLGTVPDGASWASAAAVTMPLANAGAGAPLSISAGYRTTTIVDSAHKLYATGRNAVGELGTLFVGSQINAPTAVQGFADGLTASSAAGDALTCVVRTDGTVACIGRNAHGALGRGTVGAPEVVPQPVVGLGWSAGKDAGVLRDVVKVGVGGHGTPRGCALLKHACADGGAVVCWGANAGGELGTGDTSEELPPGRVVAPL